MYWLLRQTIRWGGGGGGGLRGVTTILVPVREESYDGVYLGCMNTSDEEMIAFQVSSSLSEVMMTSAPIAYPDLLPADSGLLSSQTE